MATTTTSTSASYCTNDATFRAIGTVIGPAILAVNLIQTSDTGQINWTSVTKPTLANTVAGYEIFRFNDSLQSTSPIYIKIEYGIGNYTTTYFGFWITIGTGTNGSGTLTGNKSNRFQLAGNNDSGTRTSYFSGDTNRLAFVLWPPNTSTEWIVFGIERTHDSSGTDTGDGCHILTACQGISTLGVTQYLPLGTTTPYLPNATTNGWYCSVPLSGGGSLSPNIYTYPCKTYGMYESLPVFNFVHYAASDMTVGSTVTITGYDSTSRSYLAPGIVNSTIGWIAFTGSPLTVGLLMRYE